MKKRMAPRRRRPGPSSPRPPAAPASRLHLPLLSLSILLLAPATASAATPTITSSALLVLDPQPGDPCARSPGECGVVDSCASALRLDALANGTALLSLAGPDYAVECAKSFEQAFSSSTSYSYDPRVPARGTVRVRCSAMTGRGAEGAWPPAKGGNSNSGNDQAGGGAEGKQQLKPGQRRALVFDSFADPDLSATRQSDGRPYGDTGTVSHSLLSGPDSRMTSSALFNRQSFHAALCYPFYCPTPGCFMGRPSALVVVEVVERGSGRVLVSSAERQGTCGAWSDDYFCGRALSGFSYRVAEGSVLGEEAARPAESDEQKNKPCPVGTGPATIVVPPSAAAEAAGGDGGVKPGPRRGMCVSACDDAGGKRATAAQSAVSYAPQGAPPPGACRACPAGFLPKGAACAACDGWRGPCCATGFGPGPTKDCPPCSSDKGTAATVRLRLASIVSPRAEVSCPDFFRAGAAGLAAALSSTYLDDEAASRAAGACPPREISLSVNRACGVELRAPDCPMLDTPRRVREWSSPGKLPESALGTLPFNLTAAASAPASASDPAASAYRAAERAIERGLVTRFWTGRYDERDGNLTVAALEPVQGLGGGRGLLALRLEPVGCVFRYAVVEGALPGAEEAPVVAAAAGSAPPPLPAAARWCPGTTVKASEPAKLAGGGGEPVPVCVVAGKKP